MVTLRYKSLKSGKYSLYLDIYSSDSLGNKTREYEFLKLQVSRKYDKKSNILACDKENMELAESIRKKRELELSGKIHGIDIKRETKQLTLKKYLDAYYEKTGSKGIKTLLMWLDKYMPGKDLPLSSVTSGWLTGFKTYLLSHVSANAAFVYLKDLKARINDAIKEGIISKNPFKGFEMPVKKEPQRECLDIEQVQQLINQPFPSHPHLRLAFLFGCFTGLRSSDLYELTWDKIKKEKKEGKTVYQLEKEIVKNRENEQKILYTPLTASAGAILEELEDTKQEGRRVFYKIPSTVNGNRLLKIWAARAKVKKNLHFHVARHTFATIGLTSGIDLYTMSRLLAHKKVATTEIYAKIVDEKKRTEIMKLPKLKNKEE